MRVYKDTVFRPSKHRQRKGCCQGGEIASLLECSCVAIGQLDAQARIYRQKHAIIDTRRGADIAFDVWTLSLYSANRICTTRIDITAKNKVAAAFRSVEEIFKTAAALAA